MDVTGVTIQYPIKKGVVGQAHWLSKEIVDMMIAYEMITKGGSWFSFDEETKQEALAAGIELQEKIQGLNGVYSYIEENKQILEFFHQKIKGLICDDLS